MLEKEKIYIDYFPSFLGDIEIISNDKYLISVGVAKDKKEIKTNSITHLTKTWFENYFYEKRVTIIPPLKPAKSLFAQIVRNEVLKIGFGECKTYGEIAKNIGKPKAYRAVAQVLKYNPYMIIVPCHRIISKSGIGGYNGGIEIKKKLLEFENCELINF
ncbi:methylated-DNA--[protein]-cysteine S-methyltransferase [Nitrosophilus kaiyonis]|uniref:methylated-DNA--[protein]-cysteine S-methyltransferase n=1 Tax=Nitrosophilus kaiyonis TaxID=2930200 RepID=UPI00249274EE|nr:methylated-DNA--[protein]-cysteine S-methyltransferase [Nitrosophilus kaiyonis]